MPFDLILLLAVPLVSATCNSFTPSPAAYFTAYYPTPQQASVAYTCNGPNSNSSFVTCTPGTCGVVASGTFNLNGTTNLSLSPSDYLGFFPAVSAAMVSLGHQSLSSSICATPQSYTAACLTSNESSYVTYAPLLTCINGTLNDCSGGLVTNGTAATFCGNSTYVQDGEEIGSVVVSDIGPYQTYAAQSEKCSSGANTVYSGTWFLFAAVGVAAFWRL